MINDWRLHPVDVIEVKVIHSDLGKNYETSESSSNKHACLVSGTT